MNKKLNEIQIENYVIYIYFILLFIYLYANQIEINYINYQNEVDKEKYRTLLYIVFGISFIISLLYTISNINDLYECEKSKEIYDLKKLSTIAGILIVIATFIYIYIIYKDVDINLEISP